MTFHVALDILFRRSIGTFGTDLNMLLSGGPPHQDGVSGGELGAAGGGGGALPRLARPPRLLLAGRPRPRHAPCPAPGLRPPRPQQNYIPVLGVRPPPRPGAAHPRARARAPAPAGLAGLPLLPSLLLRPPEPLLQAAGPGRRRVRGAESDVPVPQLHVIQYLVRSGGVTRAQKKYFYVKNIFFHFSPGAVTMWGFWNVVQKCNLMFLGNYFSGKDQGLIFIVKTHPCQSVFLCQILYYYKY